jgi:XTP/dITP diphosphohydrolase
MTLELVMASANPDKVAEIEELLGRLVPYVRVLPRPTSVPDVVEDADTLTGNARLKAMALCRATGKAAVADDTGLFVDALDGQPGIYAARYAGEHVTYADNVNHLLTELTRVGAHENTQRTASFVSVALIAYPDGTELSAEGRVDGYIATQPEGAGGFGYDPVFVPHETAPQTFASLGLDAKQRLSHRSRAFTALADLLRTQMT